VTLVTWVPCDPGNPGSWVTLVPGYPNNGTLGRYDDGDSMIPVTWITQ